MTSKTYIGIGRSPDGRYFWWLTTASGHRLFNSEHFVSKRACERAIKEMKRELSAAPVMDVCARELPARRPMRLAA